MLFKKIIIGIFVFAVTMAAGTVAHAVPELGVATTFGYVGTGPLEPYQSYFSSTLYSSGTNEGFVIGPSGSDLIVFTRILDANIYLLTNSTTNANNSPTLDGSSLTEFAGTGQFDGYTPQPYWGIALGPVDTSAGWYLLPANPFSPDPYYAFDVTLTYTGQLTSAQYFFAVADDNGLSGLQANATPGSGSGRSRTPATQPDPFSPKTTSAGGHPVPEPSSLSLVGIGGLLYFLCFIGIVLRRRSVLS